MKAPQIAIAQAVRLRGRDSKPVNIVTGDGPDQLAPLKLSEAQFEDNWAIQIGAFLHKKQAEEQLDAVSGLHDLSKKQGYIRPLIRNGQTLYRARYEGLSIKEAQTACKALANLATGCLIMASN